MLKNYGYGIGFLCWMGFITFSCLTSFSDDDIPRFDVPSLDKLVHFVFYFVAAILGSMAVRERFRNHVSLLKTLLLVSVSVIIFGMIIEVLQYALTSDREGDIIDVLANSIGAFCGIWVMKSLFSGKGRLKWKN